MAVKKYLDLTGLALYDEKIKSKIETDDTSTLSAAKAYADGLADNYDPAGTAQTKVDELKNGEVADNTAAIEKLNGADTEDGSVAKQVKDAKIELEGKIGTLGDLDTTSKTDLVSAINEVRSAVSAGGTEAHVTIDSSTTTEGMAKSYTIKQGSSTVGVIDIPKDMVVSSGTVETDPEDQDPGTYLVLTLANATNDKVYINVGTLVDIYTVEKSATKVQLAISGREISANIVAGAVTATELASNAVVTAKIADGNVTKAKLETAVQTSLGKADTALQKTSITSGSTNGTIAVGGTDVAVKGLGSAAYTNSNAYATSSQGAKADTALQPEDIVEGSTNGTISVDGTAVKVHGLNSAAYLTAGSANGNVPVNGASLGTTANVPVVTNASGKLVPHSSGALGSAAFADTDDFDAAGTAQTKVDALANGAVKTNTDNITSLTSRVNALEEDEYIAITSQEIEALFTA